MAAACHAEIKVMTAVYTLPGELDGEWGAGLMPACLPGVGTPALRPLSLPIPPYPSAGPGADLSAKHFPQCGKDITEGNGYK